MITFEFLNQQHQTSRVIGDLRGDADATDPNASLPTVVLVGGMHGNEPSGVIAIGRVIEEIRRRDLSIRGRLVGLVGNLEAVRRNVRFIDADLNRLWDRQFTKRFGAQHHSADVSEHGEQAELFEVIGPLIEQAKRDSKVHRELFFLDLHTTSSRSEPFIAINDQLNNRRFARSFPVPTVLGIEEYLSGPLLSYLNDFGPVALAFEAGQHEDPEAIEMHVSFIWVSLVTAGVLEPSQVEGLKEHEQRLGRNVTADGMYEVFHRHSIQPKDGFEMKPGFRNFSQIDKGEWLASDQHGPIHSPSRGRVFMPLYQQSGNDGFFLVRRIPRWALSLSAALRRFRFDRFLVCLPGVSRSSTQPETLVVDRRVARFLATKLFHLLGYRRKAVDGDRLLFSRREIGGESGSS